MPIHAIGLIYFGADEWLLVINALLLGVGGWGAAPTDHLYWSLETKIEVSGIIIINCTSPLKDSSLADQQCFGNNGSLLSRRSINYHNMNSNDNVPGTN